MLQCQVRIFLSTTAYKGELSVEIAITISGFSILLFILVGQCFLLPSEGWPLYPLPSKVNRGGKQQLQTIRPYNVAHRGANGEIPEETSLSYMVHLFFSSVCMSMISKSH